MEGKLCLILVLLCITTSVLGRKHRRNEHISNEVDTQSVQVGSESEKPRHHAFAIAIRIPRLRLLSGKMPGLDMGNNMMNDMQEKDPNMKTTTKTSNSTHGPFRTFTVTQESVSRDNKTNSSVIMESVKSVTTLDKNLTPEQKKKLANGELQNDENENHRMPNLFHWNFRFPFGPASDETEPPKPECDEKSSCKSDHFCDDGMCVKKLAPGARCFKKNQCESHDGQYQCTWGVCALNSEHGSAGTFCDDDNSCTASQDMTCRYQNDISPRDKVCLPKLGEEGAYCGKVSFLGFFAADHDFNLCKTGLLCKVVGFRGIKRCVKEEEFPSNLQKDSSKEESTKHEEISEQHENDQKPEEQKSEEKLTFTGHHHHHHHHH